MKKKEEKGISASGGKISAGKKKSNCGSGGGVGRVHAKEVESAAEPFQGESSRKGSVLVPKD